MFFACHGSENDACQKLALLVKSSLLSQTWTDRSPKMVRPFDELVLLVMLDGVL